MTRTIVATICTLFVAVFAHGQVTDSSNIYRSASLTREFMAYMDTAFRMPDFFYNNGIYPLRITIVVEEDGTVSDIHDTRTSYVLIDHSEIRKLPNCNPKIERGRAVRSLYTMSYAYEGELFPAGAYANDFDECEHRFKADRTKVYEPLPFYKGQFSDISQREGAVSFYCWILVYHDGSVSRPIPLCGGSLPGAIEKFEQKMQAIDGGKAWIPAKTNDENVDCPMIISLKY